MGIAYTRVPTTLDTYRLIYGNHHEDLVTWSTFSDPEGEHGQPRMDTEWGFKGADAPLIGIRTTWSRLDENSRRIGEKHECWIYRVTYESEEES